MMLLWSAIIAALVGLASAVVSPRDSGFYTLTQDQINSTNLYAQYASVVKCQPQTLIHWNCGRAYLTCVPFFFLREERCGAVHDELVLTHCFLVKFIAKRLPISSYTQTAVMEVKFSSVERSPIGELPFSCHLHADAVQKGSWVTIRP
jgi:hypothetical protein